VKYSYKLVFREGLIIAAVGAVLAFAANAISPRGLSLGRNYFLDGNSPAQPAARGTNSIAPADDSSPEAVLAAHFKEKGLQAVTTDQVRQLSSDPGFSQGLIIFVDARSASHYEEGHIPGAYLLDYYQYENQIAQVLAASQSARQIIVYCGGGKCEDSEFATLMLRDNAQIPGNKLFIYTGGITEWTDKNLPLETGPRNSGKLLDRTHVAK
jgi:rhodanese-related sulfurtransferase